MWFKRLWFHMWRLFFPIQSIINSDFDVLSLFFCLFAFGFWLLPNASDFSFRR